jgi:hypothetical protein
VKKAENSVTPDTRRLRQENNAANINQQYNTLTDILAPTLGVCGDPRASLPFLSGVLNCGEPCGRNRQLPGVMGV